MKNLIILNKKMRDDSNQTRHHIIEFSYPKGGVRKGVSFCGHWYRRYGGVSSWKEGWL